MRDNLDYNKKIQVKETDKTVQNEIRDNIDNKKEQLKGNYKTRKRKGRNNFDNYTKQQVKETDKRSKE